MNSSRFIHSEEVRYGCTLCGECCKEPWRVPVEKATRKSLSERDWSGTPLEKLAGSDQDFFFEQAPTLPTGAAFQTRPETGGCILQGEDGLCLAHANFGVNAKGVVCRLFPFLFVQAPEGVYTGYSFVCRPVRKLEELKTAGEILDESTENIYEEAKNYFPNVHYQQAPETVELAPGVNLPWTAYIKIEQGLLDILSRDVHGLRFNLVSGYFYLNLAGLFLREYQNESPEALTEKTAYFVEKMDEEKFDRVDRMSRKTKPRLFVRKYATSAMLALHEEGLRARTKRDRQGGPGAISRVGLTKALVGHLLRPRPSAELPEQEFNEAVGRYLRHVIWRKGLALGRGLYRLGGLGREYAMLLIHFSMIEYHARRLVRQLPVDDATAEAIRLVERDYVLHAGRDETGPAEEDRDTFDLFVNLFDRMVGAKSFAASMVNLK
jgi:hypothetical protein